MGQVKNAVTSAEWAGQSQERISELAHDTRNLHTSENRDWNTPRRISNSYRNITEEPSSGEARRERGRICGTVMN